jgi:hypothetical protein
MPTSRRACPKPGCPNKQPCAAHPRPSPSARGYNRRHRDLRDAIAPAVAAGHATCWRCRQPISPGEPWDLGHDDHDRSITRGPEHAGHCNRSTAGRLSHQRKQ